MHLSQGFPVQSAVFHDSNLVSHAGLAPAVVLASRAGLVELSDGS